MVIAESTHPRGELFVVSVRLMATGVLNRLCAIKLTSLVLLESINAVCAVNPVNDPVFAATLPIGAGEASRFAFAPSTYPLLAASPAFCGVGTLGGVANVFTPATV